MSVADHSFKDPSYVVPPDGEPPNKNNDGGHGELPPSYAKSTNTRKLTFTEQLTPSVDDCIAHLELLSAFADLRDEVSHQDGLYGISGTDKQEIDRRWEIFVAQAVDRFEAWYETCVPATNISADLPFVTCAASGLVKLDPTAAQGSRPLTLPPLDVLMVWHSYMLSPHHFLDDCLRSQRLGFWQFGLPWSEIHECMSDDTVYMPPPHAIEAFVERTGRHWEAIEEAVEGEKTVVCPMCSAALRVPWRKYTKASMARRCGKCGFSVTHDSLKLMKFRKDATDLYHFDKPLSWTCLNTSGKPLASREHIYVNLLLLKAMSEDEILAETDPRLKTPVTSLRGIVETVNQNETAVSKLTRTGGPNRPQRMSERRMVSAYCETSTPFASLDLQAAVLRQGSFIAKMDDLDWLHSPALRGTMSRLLEKYEVFIKLIAESIGKMAVPTLDVDLAWHTHQLAPKKYYTYCQQRARSLINHDDRVVEGKLSDSFEWTSQEYQKLTGEAYTSCACWYCELMREPAHKSLFSRKTGPKLREGPADSVHISTHNAVVNEANEPRVYSEEVRRERLMKQYEKVAKRLRKRGLEPPPVTGFPYAADPQFSVNYDSSATCVAGNCSGRVGVGECSSGSCMGRSAGGPDPKISGERANPYLLAGGLLGMPGACISSGAAGCGGF